MITEFQNSNVPDFAEDPFKDYRYEDPFNIQDPFEDNEGNRAHHTFENFPFFRRIFGFNPLHGPGIHDF